MLCLVAAQKTSIYFTLLCCLFKKGYDEKCYVVYIFTTIKKKKLTLKIGVYFFQETERSSVFSVISKSAN